MIGPNPAMTIEGRDGHSSHALDAIARLRHRFSFTPREAEVALLLEIRYSNIEIAEELGISRHTARHHVQSVLLKLGVHSRLEARRLMKQRHAS